MVVSGYKFWVKWFSREDVISKPFIHAPVRYMYLGCMLSIVREGVPRDT